MTTTASNGADTSGHYNDASDGPTRVTRTRTTTGLKPQSHPDSACLRPVWLLGWVSFFTDTASEMVYPLLPLFLTRVLGAGAMSLGVIEGVAEAANSVLKIWSGRLADRTGAPKRLVLAGYGLSSSMRPFISVVGTLDAGPGAAIRRSPWQGHPRRAPRRHARVVRHRHQSRPRSSASTAPWITRAPSSARCSRRSFSTSIPSSTRTLFALTIIPGIVVMRNPLARAGACARIEALHSTTPRNYPVSHTTSIEQALQLYARWPSSSSSASATPRTRSCCCAWGTSASRRSGSRCSGPASTSSK